MSWKPEVIVATPVRAAFVNLRHEAESLVMRAEWASSPEQFEEEESQDYNLRSALESAHYLVDLVHELKQAIRDEEKK